MSNVVDLKSFVEKRAEDKQSKSSVFVRVVDRTNGDVKFEGECLTSVISVNTPEGVIQKEGRLTIVHWVPGFENTEDVVETWVETGIASLGCVMGDGSVVVNPYFTDALLTAPMEGENFVYCLRRKFEDFAARAFGAKVQYLRSPAGFEYQFLTERLTYANYQTKETVV